MTRLIVPGSVAMTALLAVAAPAYAVDQVIATEQARIRVQTVADGLEHPWGIAFLPDGSALVTERRGRLRHVSADGVLSEPLGGVPEVDARGQGGLLDVAIDPDFAQTRRVYLSFSEPGEGGNSTAVVRGTLAETMSELGEVEVIFSQQPKVESTAHYGSRLVFDAEGDLFVTMGERSKDQFRGQAQDLDSHLGKIVRLHPDGAVPEDNPFLQTEGALPEIWSYGHRNIQAAAINPETGALWEIEHGPKGGDELNIPEAGKNYGWPVVSFGVNYSGTPVGSGKSGGPEFEAPIHQWTPVIAPSGMAFPTSGAFPDWKGDLLVGGLKVTSLVRLELEGDTVISEERMLTELGLRIRDVVEGPDGAIYLLTDESDGEVLKITPAGDGEEDGGTEDRDSIVTE